MVNVVELLEKMEDVDYVETVHPRFEEDEWNYLMDLVQKNITEVD